MTRKNLIFVTIVNFLSLVMNTKRGPLRACVRTTIFSQGGRIQRFLIFDVPAHVVSGNQNRKTNAVKNIAELAESAPIRGKLRRINIEEATGTSYTEETFLCLAFYADCISIVTRQDRLLWSISRWRFPLALAIKGFCVAEISETQIARVFNTPTVTIGCS